MGNNIDLDEYEVANLLGLLKRSSHIDNGDWYMQIVHKLFENCKYSKTNNFCDKIPFGFGFYDWFHNRIRRTKHGNLK